MKKFPMSTMPVDAPVVLHRLSDYLASTIDHDKRYLFEWRTKKLEVDPVYAFEWASDAIASSARLHACTTIEAWLAAVTDFSYGKVKEFFEAAMKECHDRAWREAKYPTRSTSPTSNHVAQEKASAFVNLHEYLSKIAV